MDERASYPGWETVRKIGSGSFGAVYEINRALPNGKVEKAALKVISIPQSEGDVDELYGNGYDDASITDHFKSYLADIVNEYSLMSEIKGHTNVVCCDDIRYVQHADGFGWDIFIKMELLTPLPKIRDMGSPEDMTLRLGQGLCSALVLCREKNIIHRDIKPQNIFVSEHGDFKLGDFGIAKTIEQTTGGTKIGTYGYMAPEVYNNQPYGTSADIYSLGLVMYWLLNERRLPFLPTPPKAPSVEESEQARLRRFQGEPLPAPVHGSEGLKGIVLKACAFDPKDRYHTAEEMLHELVLLSIDGFQKKEVTVEPTAENVSPEKEPELEHVDASPDDDETVTAGIWEAEPRNPENAEPKKTVVPETASENAGVQAGDVVTFGSYRRHHQPDAQKAPIEWIILEKRENRALVLSKNVLDCQPYNVSADSALWKTSTLRAWLNRDFCSAVFNDREQQAIVRTMVSASINPFSGVYAGNTTFDRVFLLSISQVRRYFADANMRKCAPVTYVLTKEGLLHQADGKCACWWWLRTPGSGPEYISTVENDGSVNYNGRNVGTAGGGVRPAMWINLP